MLQTWSLFPFVGSTTNSPLRSNRQLNHSTNPESEDDDFLEHFDRLITVYSLYFIIEKLAF